MSTPVIKIGSNVRLGTENYGPIGNVYLWRADEDTYYVRWPNGTRSGWKSGQLKEVVSETTSAIGGDAAWSEVAEMIPLPTLKRILAKRDPEPEAKRQLSPLFYNGMKISDLIVALGKLSDSGATVTINRDQNQNLVIRMDVDPVLPNGTIVTNPITSFTGIDTTLYAPCYRNPWTTPHSPATTSGNAK